MEMTSQVGLDRKPARRRDAADPLATHKIYIIILNDYGTNQGRLTLLRDLTISQSAPYR